MGTLEIVIIVFVGLIAIFGLYSIFFSKKVKAIKNKRKEQKEQKKAEKLKRKQDKKQSKKGASEAAGKERKIEPAVVSKKKPETQKPELEQQEPPAVVATEPEKKKPEPFRIIRKTSQVKINKKALKNGSRNPSITKVFENGKRIDAVEPQEVEPVSKKVETQETQEAPVYEIIREDVGDFGFREPKYLEESTEGGFRIVPPKGLPNRAPIIGDRTNFTSRLTVSSDNNFSGVSGPGINKAIESVNKQTEKIEKKTVDLVEEVRRKLLGERDRLKGEPSFNGQGYEEFMVDNTKNATSKFKSIDAETLIIADAISNPKYKKQ